MSKLYDSFEAAGIDLAGAGDNDTVTIECPECSGTRKKKHTRSLRVTRSAGLWTCYHCQWSGAVRQDNHVPQRPTYNKPTITFTSELPQAVTDYLVGERGIDPAVLTPDIIGFSGPCQELFPRGEL